jgi:hypothetical protein
LIGQKLNTNAVSPKVISDKQELNEKYNNNLNYFAYLTSGFHSVSDSYLRNKINEINTKPK